ncbi:FadR/GntR family transcriptional regulator [Microbacterium sp. W4I20]|jgi:GntR family transcriptional repressor for pyruvate dehydrogenase complex|uniref:FadR/GntR family transcriptional regulator n=1 Tax=Microbacterium sp. W4I20 TaxID=3042262 RepID=UPI00277D8434|nr:FCD domain-containing protein [Microbacterium sp. W4I20]MDQ0726505.1 GntR family transcriptional repressor for pyruvate dehydrogenase complex [Microbacterium sp. W4I20]
MEARGGTAGVDVDLALFSAPGSAALTRLSAVETVRARILLSVEHALLAPGSRLPGVEHIAAGLEVSAITARRALESLVLDGVLVRRPGRAGGTFVADAPPHLSDSSVSAYRADAESIRRLIDQRSLMESAIVHEMALVATEEQCEELDRLVLASQQAANWLEHHGPDSRFHRLCATWSGLPEAPAYLAVYEALVKYFVPYPMDQLEVGRDEHRALVAAFRAHDPIAAVAVTRAHVDALRREMFLALPRAT